MGKKAKIKQAILKTYMAKEVSHDELDMINRNVILGKNWDNNKFEWPINITKVKKGAEDQYSYRGEAEPLSISTLLDTLTKLKEKGCSHVEIMHHDDHHGYNINGLEMHKATQDEIKSYEKEEFERAKVRNLKYIEQCEQAIVNAKKKLDETK